ncbi:MAG: elongation factor P maturation arginine rhamnosyltransferase EarP [Propionivibrio sp.]|uniref:elongation factor P maturation arginine rhamnosyltransferase EarP n=1 Tax=Propionivibrio sp. TaxID=2212460 RepID=UPI0025ED0128|nr:elongation factor P maturation arginine rhamnosyltransferase EarP [Propionivibrio sp.]MBL0207625.1 elongation factor P maturation arginine rhamnosyltransferase EarP [Propionivibrio sp.]
MIRPARQVAWDVFCHVIDNYGDIGVCWRLARQLTSEHGCAVRLWVNDLTAFRRICPEIDPLLPAQYAQGVEVRHWVAGFPDVVPGDVVIEAFACQLPDNFVAAMAARRVSPVWVNLEYLSAEAWVTGCHTLPSPHPRFPLTKYFFFPGFSETNGGVLRERDLEDRRTAFCNSPEQQIEFWLSLGFPPPPADALVISFFSYENAMIGDLLTVWAQGKVPICCLAPETQTLTLLETFAGQSLRAGNTKRFGQLEIRVLPFVAQTDYDRLLWASDINFVRGEDSFVRAQWAEKPMVWHIYPQDEGAHLIKLGAFLDLYTASASTATADAVRGFHGAWNARMSGDEQPGLITPELWQRCLDALPDLRRLALNWANYLKKQDDLCSRLVRFCRSKL